MKRTMAVILAGGEGERLSILSSVRAKPAVPFGGKYRIIDFSLSNCVNSDIDDVVVLTQYNPRSLNDHIGLGRPWDLDRNTGGVKMLQPYIARGRVAEWYRGTADAVLQNFNVLEHSSADTILVLAGDHIYKMDYQPFVAAHRARRADVTIAVRRVPLADASRMGILAMDDVAPGDRVAGEAQAAQERPRLDGRLRLHQAGPAALAVRGPDRLRRRTSSRRCSTAAPGSSATGSTATGRTSGRSSRSGRPTWPSSTTRPSSTCTTATGSSTPGPRSAHRPRSAPTSQVHRSLISHGCVINGTVVNSVLSPGVRVEVGAVVRDSIVMFDSVIRSGAVVDRSILDKEVVVGPGAIVGEGTDLSTPNRQEPARLFTGHHGRRQALGHPAQHAHRPQREDRRRRPLDGLHVPGHQERLDGRAQGIAPDAAVGRPGDARRSASPAPATARSAAGARPGASWRPREPTRRLRTRRAGRPPPGAGSRRAGAEPARADARTAGRARPLDCRACLRRTVPRPPRTRASSRPG